MRAEVSLELASARLPSTAVLAPRAGSSSSKKERCAAILSTDSSVRSTSYYPARAVVVSEADAECINLMGIRQYR